MYALSDNHRRQLLRLAFLTICGGTAVLPFTAPPGSAIARAELAPRSSSISVPEVPGRLQFPPIVVARDPFVADASGVPENATSTGPAAELANTDEIGIVLPPNAGARGAAPDALSAGAPTVRGIVLGDAPQALIDAGNGVKVFSVGDSLGSDTIKSIDAGGILLSSGVRIAIAHGQQ